MDPHGIVGEDGIKEDSVVNNVESPGPDAAAPDTKPAHHGSQLKYGIVGVVLVVKVTALWKTAVRKPIRSRQGKQLGRWD